MALFSCIPWSIPIPTKDYPLIAGGVIAGRRVRPRTVSRVKNHTFFIEITYSLRVMAFFSPPNRQLFL
jgi:hypothetical protein